ncbi:hypothetical protein TNCT_418261 [Trichonephila clavata]|uniref:Uncharacterized protein n=1 Tax=Trichonephila clavata TaxID=2740835 RepID=A0A8X6I2V4_TRICU|nr:hypothetical protein TNCT_418261 [Trichonephila clavata]
MEKGFRETVENKGRWVLTDEMLKVQGELKSNALQEATSKGGRGHPNRGNPVIRPDRRIRFGQRSEKGRWGEAVLKKIKGKKVVGKEKESGCPTGKMLSMETRKKTSVLPLMMNAWGILFSSGTRMGSSPHVFYT